MKKCNSFCNLDHVSYPKVASKRSLSVIIWPIVAPCNYSLSEQYFIYQFRINIITFICHIKAVRILVMGFSARRLQIGPLCVSNQDALKANMEPLSFITRLLFQFICFMNNNDLSYFPQTNSSKLHMELRYDVFSQNPLLKF